MTIKHTALGLGILLLFSLVTSLLPGGDAPVGAVSDATAHAAGDVDVMPAVNRHQTAPARADEPTPQFAEDDRRLAEAAIEKGDWRLAELHLMRAVELSRGDVEIVDRLIDAKAARVKEHLRGDEHASAMARVEEAAGVVDTLRRTFMSHYTAPRELGAVAQMERRLNGLRYEVRGDAIGKAADKVAHAAALAEEAHWPWYSFKENDRGLIRDALKTLLWVHRRFDFVDDTTRGEYFHVLTELKDMVADSEWAPLTASAGFVSRG